MVTPWYSNGHLMEFLPRHLTCNRLALILGIASGLAYLHKPNPTAVVHGDLRGANILMSDNFTPMIADFGLSRVFEDLSQDPEYPESFSDDTSTGNRGGAIRWFAPELVDGQYDLPRPMLTPETDVYSLAMVMIEVFTGTRPFANLRNDSLVQKALENGSRPLKPDASGNGLTPQIWELIQRCWDQDPSHRPLAREVVSILDT